jgi:hypothetical protein
VRAWATGRPKPSPAWGARNWNSRERCAAAGCRVAGLAGGQGGSIDACRSGAWTLGGRRHAPGVPRTISRARARAADGAPSPHAAARAQAGEPLQLVKQARGGGSASGLSRPTGGSLLSDEWAAAGDGSGSGPEVLLQVGGDAPGAGEQAGAGLGSEHRCANISWRACNVGAHPFPLGPHRARL